MDWIRWSKKEKKGADQSPLFSIYWLSFIGVDVKWCRCWMAYIYGMVLAYNWWFIRFAGCYKVRHGLPTRTPGRNSPFQAFHAHFKPFQDLASMTIAHSPCPSLKTPISSLMIQITISSSSNHCRKSSQKDSTRYWHNLTNELSFAWFKIITRNKNNQKQ